MKKRLKNTLILVFSMLLVVLITSCVGTIQLGPWTITITNTSGVIIDLFISASSDGPWALQDSYFPGGPFATQTIAHGTFIRIYRRPPLDAFWWWNWGGDSWRSYWQVNESFSVTITDGMIVVGERASEGFLNESWLPPKPSEQRICPGEKKAKIFHGIRSIKGVSFRMWGM